MVAFSRRDVVLRTAAMAAAGATADPWPAAAATPLRASTSGRDIDAALRAMVDSGKVPGIVAMAASAQGPIYQGAFGARAQGAAARMTLDTLFRIASMAKLVTSVAALQLVEQGRLKLDEPAANVDPALAALPVLTGFDAKGVPQLRPPRQPITLRNLLSHTSGLSYPLWDADAKRYGRAARSDPALPRSVLMFDPERRWAYGGSLDRVGRLIEIASGRTLDRYFADHILRPLGMNDTGFAISEPQRAREAHLHVRRSDGTLKPEPLERHTSPRTVSGGGGLYSTAPDFLILLQALLNGGSLAGTSILRPRTLALMATNQIGDLAAGVMKTTNPALSNDVDFFPGNRLRWGIGHMINLDPVEGGRKGGSLTWAGLFNTYYWIDPASGIAGVIMMQILPFADAPALDACRAFERALYRAHTAT
ncbi:Esterase EstB [Bradyrhizobium ivorense]|uniref:Esterase EstB n=1 Tax=Bradyrhizobium ivorense TaxID=2511166 RepID=A0A508U3J1_9BRAD|nr:serine hydrolase domain-containing protein [Bradyrhizobium ivorense]VIO80928.1 Esterase EstB [Bradyrhizobium ivorense]